MRHPPARAQQHVHPRGARPVLRCPPPCSHPCLPHHPPHEPPNPPTTFPTHVDWLMHASMSGAPVPTHTNDALRHPTTRMKHQPSLPALLDGTGLLQMPLQRAQSPETMQDNRSNWDHMRHTRRHKRQHEPNETPRHSATHTHLRGSSNAPLTALDPPISLPQASAAIGVHLYPKAQLFYTRRLNCFIPEGSIVLYPKAQLLIPEGSMPKVLLNKVHIPKAHFCFYFLPIGTELESTLLIPEGSIAYTRRLNCFIPEGSIVHTRRACEMVRTPCSRCSRASASRPNDERVKRQRDRLVQSEAM